MKFLDYEKIIRSKYSYLIDSYVSQYGENYREKIVKRLEDIKYCFYVTPSNLINYVNSKKNEDCIKAILDSYLELDIDISNVAIVDEGLDIRDEYLSNMTMILFPNLEDSSELYQSGIFSFDDKYDDMNNPIFKERITLFEKLNIKDRDSTLEDFIETEEYKRYTNVFKRVYAIIKKNFEKRCSNDYTDLLNYADFLNRKTNEIGEQYQRRFFSAISDDLFTREKIVNDSNFDIKQLKDYHLYFDDDCDVYSFGEGLLDYFFDYYTGILKDNNASLKEKEDIIEKRFCYLNSKGIDTGVLRLKNLFCDWYQIDEIKQYLPDREYLDNISNIKNELYDKYCLELASSYVINDHELDIKSSEIDTIIDGIGHSFSINPHNFNRDNKNQLVVCFCPLLDTYNLFDIIIDHELRHAIETSITKCDDKYFIKIGIDLMNYSSSSNDIIINDDYNDYNERVTQKLSVEATKKRWQNGQFIISDEYALITDYPSSIYDVDISNLDIIFEPLRDELIEAQISSDPNKIFEIIPSNKLKTINKEITSYSETSKKILNTISKKLKRKNIKRKIISKK